MSSSMSRLIWDNSMLSLKSSDKSLPFNPISKTPFLKNKEYAWNLQGRSCRSLQYLINKPMNQQTMFVIRSNVNPPPAGVPDPSGPPSGSLRNWIVGIVLTFVLPFFTHKWGSFLLLKNKIDKKIETTEHVVKGIEKVAERVDKVIDSITDDLPEESKLKKALVFVDEIAEGVAKTAHVADTIINKVEEAEDKLDSFIHQENQKGEETAQKAKDKESQEITAQDQENDK
ncbi:uncharacterized protein LOC112511756 isoform X2 [Cynara cardunculus var. scolymus]|uniref:uncharacterized protein LOC112511756 isoform X2 n=1 Tax=Cynara cardunculus var. scolymus TaxID=59895 RepID=UPI000D62D8B7|nr:uncharacterized protein LOC112511756 isoform X2 [Cynara cardunculus var. scolymus]